MNAEPRPTVLLVEDEPALVRFLRAALRSESFRLLEATSVREALAMIVTEVPDVVLLDIGLPDGSGIDLTRQVRAWSPVPILVLSARGREEDKVLALDAGADDYLTKPFGVRELLARLRALLRRAQRDEASSEPVFVSGDLRVDIGRREVTRGGQSIHLTPIEWKLLTLLFRNEGKVLTHRMILDRVWGRGAAEPHYVRVHIAELRKKVERNPTRPELIVTEPGVGYRLRPGNPA